MLELEKMRAMLAENERRAKVRSLYHRVSGEVIVFDLTFTGGPEFTVTEDESAETVTLSPGDEQLVLLASQFAGPGVLDELRSWIEARVDVAAPPFSKSRVTARETYWGDLAFHSRWGA